MKYHRVVALDSLSVSLPSGIIGLLGPNGAGKSTLIKVLMGLKQPEKGRVTLDGMIPWKHTLYVRDGVGYMPEHDCLIEEMNAVSFVSYFGKISGMEEEDAIWRAHEVLDFVDVGEERYRKIGSYSKGMKQRVKLAQSIVHDPSILMLDEPTEGMDPDGKEEMLNLISLIGDTGKTIIVSSHQLHEIEKTADHVVIIDKGRALKTGPMQEILKGDEKTLVIKVRGDQKDIKNFKAQIKSRCEVHRSDLRGDELEILLKWDKDSKELFKLALENDLYVRSYKPHIRSLEDVFFMAFRRGN